MYQSNRDIQWAIQQGMLIVEPPPEFFDAGYDETSIDLHMGHIDEARVWDSTRLAREQGRSEAEGPELRLGSFIWFEFSKDYLIPPPNAATAGPEQRVVRRGSELIVKPGGFVLWTTKEKVGTPTTNPAFIGFVNSKSTKARVGAQVHLTAPTIHAGWSGNITLEITNLGPFHFVLLEDDVIAQLTVARISSSPNLELRQNPSLTAGQAHVTGRPEPPPRRPRRRKSR